MEEGELTIPSVPFHYFEPSSGSYRTITAEGRTLVIEGVNPRADLILSENGNDQSLLLSALPSPRQITAGRPVLRIPDTLFWVLVAFPPACFLLVVFSAGIRRRRARTEVFRTRKTAGRRAQVAVRHASRQKSREDALGQVANAVRQYLRERMDIKAGALTTEGTIEALRTKGFSRALAHDVSDLLETSELARFDREGIDGHTVQTLAKRARKVLKQLEAGA
jgi:hypothetical protein